MPSRRRSRVASASGGLEFVCGIKNAEDLVLVPDTPWIIASGMAAGAGITLIDSRNGAHSTLYPGESPRASHDALFADCTTPPAPATVVTHGLNLRPGNNGHSTLYAVGHGAREAIEVFDVDATGARPALTWKGCVPMPEGLAANSVASFADGSLVATVLLMPGKTFADSCRAQADGRGVRVVARQARVRADTRQRAAGQQRHRSLGGRPRDLRRVVRLSDDRRVLARESDEATAHDAAAAVHAGQRASWRPTGVCSRPA